MIRGRDRSLGGRRGGLPQGGHRLHGLVTLFSGLALAVAVPGCGDASGDRHADGWTAQVDTIGDTLVVRTVAGSEWGAARLVPELRIGVLEGAEHEMFGEIQGLAVDEEDRVYVYDRLATALRRFGPDGAYLGTLNRQGGGPGEVQNSDGGLAVLPGGRVVIRDPGNGRFTVYGPDGAYRESWPGPASAFTSIPLFPAADGGFYSYNFAAGATGLVRFGPDGAPRDTLVLPDRQIEPAWLTARNEGSMQRMNVPFWPTAQWTFHPDGYYVSAVTSRYAVDLLRGETGAGEGPTVLRIERTADAVPVAREERIAQERRITEIMRRLDPSWRWDGPPVPETKPLIRSLLTGDDGRIWVQLHQPAVRIQDEGEPGPDGGPPPPRFEEPIVFDVFEADGRYLGRIHAPEGLATFPRMVARGDHVWGVVRGELDVQQVVRYRIEPEAPDD